MGGGRGGREFRLARVCLRSKAGLSYLRPRVSGTVFLLHRGLRHSPAGLTLGSYWGEGGGHELWFLVTVALCETGAWERLSGKRKPQ